MSVQESIISKDILEIYTKILRRHPQMWKTALIAKMARSRAIYPIIDYDELMCIAANDDGNLLDIEGEAITSRKVKKYFPRRFFPIENEDDLISKLLASFLWAEKRHVLELELVKGIREGLYVNESRL